MKAPIDIAKIMIEELARHGYTIPLTKSASRYLKPKTKLASQPMRRQTEATAKKKTVRKVRAGV